MTNLFNSNIFKNYFFYILLSSVPFLHIYEHATGSGIIEENSLLVRLMVDIHLAVAIIFYLIFVFFRNENGRSFLFMNGLLIIFISIIVAVILLDNTYTDKYFYDRSLSLKAYNLQIVLRYFAWLSIGFLFQYRNEYKNVILVFFVLMTVNIMYSYNPDTLQLDYSAGRGQSIFLADSYVFWALLTVSVFNSVIARNVVVFLSIISTYLIGSRTGLYTFLMTIPFIFYLDKRRIFLYVSIFCVVSYMVFNYLQTERYIDVISESRMTNFLETGEDSSLDERMFQMEKGIEAIKENWFLGDYGGQVRDFGTIGSYIHNILSYGRQFGLVPFLILLVFMVHLLIEIWHVFRGLQKKSSGQEKDLFFVLAGIVFFAGLILSRSYVNVWIWFFIGIMFRKKQDRRAGK